MTVLSLDDFHRMHPWPRRYGDGKLIEFLWHFDLSLAPGELWPIISDTSRMNRALGTAPMRFEDRDGQRFGTSTSGGRRHAWLEVPWNWVAGEWLESVRVYQRGYPRVAHSVHRVEGHGTGSRYYTYFGFLPRGPWAAALIKLGFGSTERSYRTVLAEIDRRATSLAGALVIAPPALSPEAQRRIAVIATDLVTKRLDPLGVERLCQWIATADDLEVTRIQVRERARAWGLDENQLLSVFLHATRAGLLQLSWDIVCPHCRGAGGVGTLDALPTSAHCETCAIDFGTDRDHAVEITFRVHSSIRVVVERAFCSSEPAQKDHIRVQHLLPPGARAELQPSLSPRRYRARVEGELGYGYIDDWRANAAPTERSVSSTPRLQLHNDRDRDAVFVIENPQWSDVALRPGRLLSFQDFRDLFSEEYLGADVQLAIGEQTILFTDMVGSTELYASRGDPAAFVEVRRHFASVFALIAEHRGAVVKTIGDAAMAAFGDPLDAVKCAKAIHDRFSPNCSDSVAVLRISLNTGPCIAVRLNANIDYFGGTVNVAAKLQSLAEAWQITMAQSTYDAPGVAAWLTDAGATVESLHYCSKALTHDVPVRRWTVYSAPA
jgi:class 3 adenylate cyclase